MIDFNNLDLKKVSEMLLNRKEDKEGISKEIEGIAYGITKGVLKAYDEQIKARQNKGGTNI